ncbi:hypothetical protein BGX21_008500 [Mortierella sp. AD011]|nr:hypothetical protein BGX20_004800 [Mortierella sp. AD010]KAF9397799.1 hypothetical protein BGX21_008500 [Mortierella sp. AD011]
MDIPNIGQGMCLGDLYDARTGLSTNISVLRNILPETLIESRDEHAINTKFIASESYKEKFDALDVTGNLRANVLAGLVKVNAQGKYLTAEKTTSKSVKMAMSYAVQTKLDRINIRSDTMREYINTNALSDTKATHVVTGIQWGAKMVCSFEHILQEGESKEEILGFLKLSVTTIKVGVDGGGNMKKDTKESNKETSFQLSIIGDIVPEGEDYPTTVEDIITLLRNVPKSVKTLNDGKGSVMYYKLEPIGSVQKHFGLQSRIDSVLSIIHTDLIAKIEAIFDIIVENRIRLTETSNDTLEYSQFIAKTEVSRIKMNLKNFGLFEQYFKSSLHEAVKAIQIGTTEEAPEKALAQLFEEFEEGSCSSLAVDHFIASYQPLLRHISFIRYCKDVDIEVIPRGHEILDVLSASATVKTFIFLIPESFDYTTVQESDDWHIFNLLREDSKDAKFLIHDASISPMDSQSKGFKKLAIIKYYGAKKSADKDVFRASILRPSAKLSRTESMTREERTELDGNILRMPCPLSHGGECPPDAIRWVCSVCEESLQYEYNAVVYCGCGKTPIKSCTFRCNSSAHGYQYRELHAQSIGSIRKKTDSGEDEINILLLGETGVGKSTFINAFANYLQYPTLEVAEHMPLMTLIQSSFEIEGHTVNLGEPDKNENLAAGRSSTQNCRSYVFPLNEDINIRLIDTPGIGDTRGVKQDRENFEEIMDYISGFNKINGVCILMRPNSSRLTTSFQFCVDELLLHLHKSAANNILFTFTNTRSSFYKVGDTRVPLEAYLETLKKDRSITIPFKENTKFCFDNESFRLCAALQQGVSFEQRTREDFGTSWTRSAEEAKRMIKRIGELTPHITEETVNLNKARGLILLLAPTMAHINEIITIENQTAEGLKAKAKKGEITAAELEKKVMINYMDLDSISLDKPRTVCSSDSCVEIHNGDRIYKTRCHDDCQVPGVAVEIRNDVRLRYCLAMNNSATCSVCGCPWQNHLHIRVDRRRVPRQKADDARQEELQRERSKVEEMNNMIADIDKRIEAQESEKGIIFKSLTIFTSFLLQNSILVQNNAILDYIDMSITNQERMARISKDNSIVNSLIDQRREYMAQIEIFENAIKENKTESIRITAAHVIKAKNALFKLEINSLALEKALDEGKKSRTKSSNRETRVAIVHYSGNWGSTLARRIYSKAKEAFIPDALGGPREGIMSGPRA